ncbi:MAG: HDOD domain-containing protein [Opitutae bacterium]
MTLDLEENYLEVVNQLAGELPTIPLLVNDMMEVVSDPEAANFAICESISRDQSVFSKILKIANSLEYRQGREKRIVEVMDAVLTIGSDKVRQLLLNVSVLDTYTCEKIETKFKLEGLWLHSCGVALAAQLLAERYDCEYSDHAYACGLLHDLGKVAKIKFMHRKFLREVKFAQNNASSVWFAEKALGYIQHDILGSMIVEKWGISPIIEKVNRWHHTLSKDSRSDVDDPKVHKLIDVIILANHMVKELRFGNSGSGQVEDLPSGFLRRRKIDEEEYHSALGAVRMHVDAEAEKLSFLLSN